MQTCSSASDRALRGCRGKALQPRADLIVSYAMAKVHLVEGPVGAGKSTFAASLAARTGGVHIALDEWFARLFSPDRPPGDIAPWYLERKDRLLGLIWDHSRGILAADTDVILEVGLIQRHQRSAFCERIRAGGFPPTIYVIDAPRELRRERVRRRNSEKGATFSMVVPDHIFEIASDMWEAPDATECVEHRIEFIAAEY